MDSNYKIRLIKQQKIESSKIKNEGNFINSNSPIIKKLRDAEERFKLSQNVKENIKEELSDDELIELEFKEEADKIRTRQQNQNNVNNENQKESISNINLDSIHNKIQINIQEMPDSIEENDEDINTPYTQEENATRESNLDSIEEDFDGDNANLIAKDDNLDYIYESPKTRNEYSNSIDFEEDINNDLINKNSINVRLVNSNLSKEKDVIQSHSYQNLASQNSNSKEKEFENPQNINESTNESYSLPPLSLLNSPPHLKMDIDDNEIDIKVQNLFSKLKVFKIDGDIVKTYSGPVVTTFEFRPAVNVKVSRIQNLQDDLSMALKATSIRIQAPIPGKDVVGIEIPNNKIQTIYLREIFDSSEFRDSKAALAIALGKDVVGKPVVEDLALLPHLLIAGTTGSGKSVGLNAMILSLLYKNTPKDLRLIMIDPKFLEFGLYEDIPHLLTPIITDPKKAIIALSKAVEEMNRRYEMMNKVRVKTISGYNELAQNEGLEKLPYIVIIIDEFADLMIMGGREAEQYLISLAGKARASGIHLIIATQRPTVNVVTGLIKGNLPSKISYRVGSKIDSKVILDEIGAESLLGKGDMLFSKTNNILRMHAPFNDEREIEKVVEFIKSQQKVEYDPFFSLESKENIPQNIQINNLSSDDDFLQKAKEIILQTNKTSISYIQRSLGIGFNKAASIVEQLEKDGFLSAPNSKGLREILNP